jgi:hypothetical protein
VSAYVKYEEYYIYLPKTGVVSAHKSVTHIEKIQAYIRVPCSTHRL